MRRGVEREPVLRHSSQTNLRADRVGNATFEAAYGAACRRTLNKQGGVIAICSNMGSPVVASRSSNILPACRGARGLLPSAEVGRRNYERQVVSSEGATAAFERVGEL